MTGLLQSILPYIPAFTLRRVAADPAAISAPQIEKMAGAVLFADISGFTMLAERLAEQGPAGAEELSTVLNDYFGQLTAIITEHGGDVVKFAGDALLAFWPEAATPSSTLLPSVQCALVAQKELHNYQEAGGARLTMRIAVGLGEITTMYVGGVFGRWECLLAGEPINQISALQQIVPPGQVGLTPIAWQALSQHGRGQPLLPEGTTTPVGHLLQSLHEAVFPQPLEIPQVPTQAEAALRAYIPGAVMARMIAGQDVARGDHATADWLGELRRVTVLFVNLPDLTYSMPLDQAHAVVQTLQKALYHYEGSLNKLSIDDKGVTLVSALGLPPLAHEDDAVRGALAALRMKTEIAKLGVQCAIGVASGQVFCGAVGGNMRREYTLIGDTVNLAARLMQAAPNQVLCDANLYQGATARIAFESLTPITVKGKNEPVAIFRPVEEKKTALRPQTDIVGRFAERAALAEGIQSLLRGGSHINVYIIEGEAGIGKSRLVEDVRRQAQALGVQTLSGLGDAVENRTLYYGWRPVFHQLLDLDLFEDPDRLRRHVRLALGPQLLRLAPLLRDVLGLDFPDNETTAALAGAARADQTRHLLTQLVQASVTRTPKVLILEDAHWLDSASWALVLEISRKVRPLMLVIATRPLSEPLTYEYLQLLEAGNVQRLKLDVLPDEDALTLVRQRLQVTAIPDSVADLICHRAEGNPFFSEELAYALRDAGIIQVQGSECVLASAADLRNVRFPDTVQGVITSRIDRLLPAHQMALKVASVIGRVFAYRTLLEVHPIESDRPNLGDYLQKLDRLDLTPLLSPEPDLAYIFKHIITQEVAYNLMLFAQRRGLHKATAEWYEQKFGHDLTPYYPVLAHHYQRAEIWEKAQDYYNRAGDMANYLYAHAEARLHYSNALDALDQLPETPDYIRRRADVLIKRVAVAWAADDISQNFERLKQADEWLQKITEPTGPDQLLRGRVAYWRGRLHYLRNEPRDAIGYYKQAIAIGREFNDAELLAIPSSFIGQVLTVQGQATQARPLLAQAIGPLAQTANWVEWIRTVGFHSVVLMMQGLFSEGWQESDRALNRAQELRNPTGLAISHIYRSTNNVLSRDAQRLLKESEGVIQTSERSGDRMLNYMGYSFRAWANTRLGQHSAAEQDRAKSMAVGQTVGGRLLLADWYAALDAEMALNRGDLAAACELAEKTVQMTQPIGGVFAQGMAQRTWGQACAALNPPDWAAAVEHLNESLRLFETAGNRLELANTQVVLGQVYLAHAEPAAARAQFAQALQLFETSQIPHLVANTQALLQAAPA